MIRRERILVAEDDATVLEDDYISELSVADTMLILGFNWDSALVIDYGLGSVVVQHNQDTLRRMLIDGTVRRTDERLLSWPLINCFGTLAYILTPLGAHRLLAEFLPLRAGFITMPALGWKINNIGIDCQLNCIYSAIGARVLFPPRAFSANVKG